MCAVELARLGANVVGIEGREANLAKARFAKEALSLENPEFHQDDVRNLSKEKYGRFDVVLCLGILYHLNRQTFFISWRGWLRFAKSSRSYTPR